MSQDQRWGNGATRMALLIVAPLVAVGAAPSAIAQSASEEVPASLPPVVVQSAETKSAPKKKAQAKKSQARKPQTAASTVEPRNADSKQNNADGVQVETAKGPVKGYVAKQSATATKTDTPIIKTPQSISVVTRDQIDAQGAQSVSQAMRFTAGVVPEIRGTNSRYDIPVLRGFGAPTDANTFLDGLLLQRGTGYAFPQAEVYGLERIEVLKGPASMLYGSVPPGGLVNLVSKRPTETAQGEIEISAGSNDRFQGAFDVSGPANRDKTLLYRVIGLAKDANAEVVNAEEQRYFIAPSFTYRPSSDTSFTLLSSYQKDPEGGYYGVLPTLGTLWSNPNGQIPRNFNDGDPAFSNFNREQAMVGYEFNHRLNDTWSVAHNFRYTHVDVATDDVGTYALNPIDQHTILRYAIGDRETLSGVTSDLQLHGRFATGALLHKPVIGYDYQYMDWKQSQSIGYPLGVPLPGGIVGTVPPIDYLDPVYGVATGLTLYPSTDQRQTFSRSGFYAQDQVEYGKLSVIFGARYDLVDIDTDNLLLSTSQSVDDGAFSWRAGAIYQLGYGVAPYVSYSTSFVPLAGTDTTTGGAFKPTTGEQYEIGVKYQPQNFNGLFTVAYFDITQNDVVNTISTLQRYQVGEVRSKGVEFEAKIALTRELNLLGAFTYTHARVVEGLGADVGSAPVNSPDYMASVWTDYTFRQGPFDGLMIGGGMRYIGTSVGGFSPNAYTVGAIRLDMPDYTLVDATLKYDLGKLSEQFQGYSFKLNASNLLDKTYVTCNAFNFCNYGYGRTVLGSLSYRW